MINIVLPGDIWSDRGAVGGLGERSSSGRAANLLAAALWPPGQDLPEGLVSETAHDVACTHTLHINVYS